MKIVCDDRTYVVPVYDNKNILVPRNYKDDFIECMGTYFVSKKKTKCVVYDDDGQVIGPNEINFIYLDDDISYENNLDFKTKTILNSGLSEIINNNPERFHSIERIRENLHELESDRGMIEFRKILSYGISEFIDISLDELNLNTLIQMLHISNEFSRSEKQILIMNLMLYENRNKVNIVFLDKEIDNMMFDWIESQKENVYFFLDNDQLNFPVFDYSMVLLSDRDHLIVEEDTNETINILAYMNHKLIMHNISLQEKKNVEIFHRYYDENSTFFVKNVS